MTTTTLIAAMAENRVIGRDGGLPWRLPDDMRHFMQVTSGHPVIMGRRTWESMDGPLRNRRNIVLTRQEGFTAEGAEVVHDLDEAIRLVAGDGPVYVIGGGEIYSLALPVADRLDLTIVHAEIEGDARFPEWDENQWRLVGEEHHPADERHEHAFTFRVYERVRLSDPRRSD